jgi:hypothetical protein
MSGVGADRGVGFRRRAHSGPGSETPAAQGFNLTCVRCGYDLRGLGLEHVCPECGSPVAASTTRENLHYAAAWWLRSLRTGLTLLLVSLGTLAGMWISWFILGLGEINVRGAPATAEALVRPYAAISLACAVLGQCGVQLTLRRDPGDERRYPVISARRVARVAGWLAGIAGVFTPALGLLGGRAGVLLIVVLALSLSALALTAVPVLVALISRSPGRRATSAKPLVILVAGTEIAVLIYAFLLARSAGAFYVGCLFIALAIAIPAVALVYLQLIWRALCSVRAALEAQAQAGRGRS